MAIPMSSNPSSGMADPHFDSVWNDLQKGMDKIFLDKKYIPPKDYMLLYTKVYDYCTNVTTQGIHQPHHQTPNAPRAGRRAPRGGMSAPYQYGDFSNSGGNPSNVQQMRGEELYKRMRTKLDSHLVENVIPFIRNQSDDMMLQNYVHAWDEFRFSAKVLDGICDYINRNWVRRECQENGGRRTGNGSTPEQAVVEIYGMCLFAWRDQVFAELKARITATILKRIEKHREGEQVEKNIINSIVGSYVGLGVRAVCADNAQNGPAVGRGQFAAAVNAFPAPMAAMPIHNNFNGVGGSNGLSREPERFFTPTLEVYEKELQVPLLHETERYYAAESYHFLQRNSIEEYMLKALARLEEERLRCRAYLHPSTEAPLMLTMDNTLIVRHMERFHSEFMNLLNQNKIADLNRMYQLVSRVSGGLEKLFALVERHAKEKGLEAISNLGRDALEDSTKYVQTILNEHTRCMMLVKEAFKADQGFKSAVDRALSAFVNRNSVTDSSQQNANKSAEHLARYADMIMKKGSRMGGAVGGDDVGGGGAAGPSAPTASAPAGGGGATEQDSETALNQVLIIFRYIEDKDVFEKFYSRSLAKRLIFGLCESDSLEETMISRLKEACGYDYASKLQRMYTDYTANRGLNENFKQYVDNLRRGIVTPAATAAAGGAGANADGAAAAGAAEAVPAAAAAVPPAAAAAIVSAVDSLPAFAIPPISCQVLVVTSGQWPLQDTQTNFTMPDELNRCAELFKNFYDKQHNGRKLTWAHALGRCDLQTSCYKFTYHLTCNLPQTIILLHFNATLSCTYQQLLDSTKLDDSNARSSLQILALKAHLLNCISPAGGGGAASSSMADAADDASADAEGGGASSGGRSLVKSIDDITPDTIVELNKTYKNKKLRLNLNVLVKGQEKKEQEQTYKGVEGDRSIVMQAAIVRIMKARKTLKHQQLVIETFEQVARRFKPTVPVVKKAIATLIEREFIKRDDAQNDLYHYVA